MPDISLRKARIVIRAALSKGKDLGLKPLSVVVVDVGAGVVGTVDGVVVVGVVVACLYV